MIDRNKPGPGGMKGTWDNPPDTPTQPVMREITEHSDANEAFTHNPNSPKTDTASAADAAEDTGPFNVQASSENWWRSSRNITNPARRGETQK